jgi:hypothetical protein
MRWSAPAVEGRETGGEEVIVTAADNVVIRRAADRFTTVGDGVRTSHLLSFGEHYDPALTAIGPLSAHNDEIVNPGGGYASHQHRGVDIVTWVVAGRLAHRDPAGEALLEPGWVQVLSAGSGVDHEELSAVVDGGAATRFVQMWLPSDSPDQSPRYSAAQFDDEALRTRLVPIAAGAGLREGLADEAPLTIGVRGAVCLVGRLGPGDERRLPAMAGTHLFVVRGTVVLAGDSVGEVRLGAGDSALVTDVVDAVCVGLDEAEIVVWAWQLM